MSYSSDHNIKYVLVLPHDVQTEKQHYAAVVTRDGRVYYISKSELKQLRKRIKNLKVLYA
mgnify:CR=1 FL=1